MTIGMTAKKKRKPRTVACPDCHGATESVAVTVTNLDGSTGPGIDRRRVECETCDSTGKVKLARCACCGAQGAGLCKPCREAHTDRNVYIAGLRCPVKEAAETLQAETEEAFAPGSTFAPFNGHSEECFTTPPTRYTDEIEAACPKCSQSAPPAKARPVSPEIAAVLGAIGDKGNGERAPR